jgi:DASS family divalent anion:Na+ symporter
MTSYINSDAVQSLRNTGLVIALALGLWFLDPPSTVSPQGWHSFIIFITTLGLIITKTYDMGVGSFIALSLSLITGTLSIEFCLAKFSYPVTWLVLMAFFIAKGFMISGLGARIALFMASRLGSTPLRLAYALIFAETLIAPLIPSNTARGGGMMYPIAQSLGENIFGKPQPSDKNPNHWTAFLLYSCFQANLISSAMFLTAMAGNPMIISIATHFGLEHGWISWFKAALLPGTVCLLLTPLLLLLLMRPNDLKSQHDIQGKSYEAYAALGPVTLKETIMAITFIALLIAWIVGPAYGIHPTSAALIAVTGLLITSVLSWQDITSDSQAWTTFIWLTVLFTLSTAMKEFGFINWFAQSIGFYMPQANGMILLIILTFVNFYAHYFFASLTSHITTLFQPMMMVGVHTGIPLQPLLFALAFSTSLSAGLTHYGTGTGTIIYGSGYWTLKQWWFIGFLHSTVMLIIFLLLGVPFWSL